MEGARLNIEILAVEPPVPEDFGQWYPFVKPEVMAVEGPDWLEPLRQIIAGEFSGVRSTFISAWDRDAESWAGVAWVAVGEGAPELAHFGWHTVDPEYRGGGIGSQLIDHAAKFLQAEGVEVIMLATDIHTQPARTMYFRRGFDDTMLDETTGKVWMVREPKGYHEMYFARSGPIAISPFLRADLVAFDYLMSRAWRPVRMHAFGLIGGTRNVSFALGLHRAQPLSACRDGKLMGVGVRKPLRPEGWVDVDVASPDADCEVRLLEEIVPSLEGPAAAYLHETDRARMEMFAGSGFAPVEHRNYSYLPAPSPELKLLVRQ